LKSGIRVGRVEKKVVDAGGEKVGAGGLFDEADGAFREAVLGMDVGAGSSKRDGIVIGPSTDSFAVKSVVAVEVLDLDRRVCLEALENIKDGSSREAGDWKSPTNSGKVVGNEDRFGVARLCLVWVATGGVEMKAFTGTPGGGGSRRVSVGGPRFLGFGDLAGMAGVKEEPFAD